MMWFVGKKLRFLTFSAPLPQHVVDLANPILKEPSPKTNLTRC